MSPDLPTWFFLGPPVPLLWAALPIAAKAAAVVLAGAAAGMAVKKLSKTPALPEMPAPVLATPPAPEPPPATAAAPPVSAEAEAQVAADAAATEAARVEGVAAASRRRGRGATILTGGLGTANPGNVHRPILGG